ncbi:unnamed protein product [Microthlaspi erraticum]|uniref:Uncharacterized protein n=1 Tax=Microthlaspi erraticum TaxID=1685480 RepID=A0A6D2K191_9BRAS|nr:unnamed protein product [Microthlaspi erraticum]
MLWLSNLVWDLVTCLDGKAKASKASSGSSCSSASSSSSASWSKFLATSSMIISTKARELGIKASRPCNSPHVPRTNAPSDPGSNASRPAERFHRPNLSADHAGRP